MTNKLRSFLDFMRNEAVVMDDDSNLNKDDKNWYGMNGGLPFDPKQHAQELGMSLNRISTLPTGHHVYHTLHPDEPDLHTIYAWHPHDRTSHITMSAITTENITHLPKNLHVTMVSTTENSTVRAHKLYEHLINDHDVVFTAHKQTPGGFKIWQNLSKTDGITVRAFHPDSEKFTGPIKLDRIENTHVPTSKSDGQEHTEKYRMLLVASKSTNPQPKVTPPEEY